MLSFSQSSPSYDIVCPGDTLVFTCITSYQGGIFVAWRIDNTNRVLTDVNSKLLNGFIVKITDINYNTARVVSTATRESAPLQLNRTVIDCSGDLITYKSLRVHIAGKIHHEPYVS